MPYFSVKDFFLVKQIAWCIFMLILSTIKSCESQEPPQAVHPEVNCTKFYSHVQRHGALLMGKIKIPLAKIKSIKSDAVDTHEINDEHGFKLQMKFSRSIRHMHVRQAKAKDMGGSHTEFLIDTTAKDGVMKLDTTVHLRSLRGHLPRVTRIVFNDKVLCGAALTESELNESIVVDAVNKKTVAISTSTKPNRYYPATVAVDELHLQEDYY